MRLVLKNFRCHEDFSIILPDTGLILLTGVSGSGKTSILNAIKFALYDKPKKPITLGKKRACSVTYEYKDISIIRSKGPNRLIVKVKQDGNEVVGEDKQGESMIKEYFGMDECEFDASSYIKQKQMGSLLYMSPPQQLAFVEHVAFYNIPVGEFKTCCRRVIKDLETEIKEIDGKTTLLDSQISELQVNIPHSKLDEKKIKKWELEAKNIHKEYKIEQDKLNTLERDYEIYKNLIDNKKELKELEEKSEDRNKTINKELNSLDEPWKKKTNEAASAEFRKLRSLEVNINGLKRVLKSVKQQDVNLQDDISRIDSSIEEINEKQSGIVNEEEKIVELKSRLSKIDDQKNLYDKQINILKWLKIESFIDTYNEKKDSTKIIIKQAKSNMNVKKIQENIELIKKQIDSLEVKIKNIKQSRRAIPCPKCGTHLVIKNDSIIESGGERIKGNTKKIRERIDEMKKSCEDDNKKIIVINKAKVKIETLQGLTSNNTIKKPLNSKKLDKELREQVQKQSIYISCIEKLNACIVEKETINRQYRTQLKLYRRERIDYESNLGDNKLNIHEVREKMERLDIYMEDNRELERKVIKLNDKLEDDPYKYSIRTLKKKISSIKIDKNIRKLRDIQKLLCDEFADKLSQVIKREEVIKKYNEYHIFIKSLEDKKHDLDKWNEEKYKIAQKLEGYNTLKKRIEQAEHLALDRAVSGINHEAQQFLDEMFAEPISVNLESFRETKTTKSIKAQLNTTIGYKGYEYDDLSQISGGEQDRISLCYTIALSSMFRSPILLLDECLSSLDSNLNTNILMNIKKLSKERLILVVAHEAEKGLFDQVIEVTDE